MKFVCNGDCSLQVVISETGGILSGDFGFDTYYDNSTQTYYFDWRGTTSYNYSLVVYSQTDTFNVLCDKSLVGASGTLSCDMSSYDGGTYLAYGFRKQNPNETLFMGSFYKVINETILTVSSYVTREQGNFWTAIIVLTTSLAGIFNPIAVMIMAVLGLIVTAIFNFGSWISYGFILLAFIVGITLSVLIKDR
jgi:hypothetical protein